MRSGRESWKERAPRIASALANRTEQACGRSTVRLEGSFGRIDLGADTDH